MEVDTLCFVFLVLCVCFFFCSLLSYLMDNPGFVARFRDENSFVLRNKSNDFKQINFNQLN